jgi:hypothetical protein
LEEFIVAALQRNFGRDSVKDKAYRATSMDQKTPRKENIGLRGMFEVEEFSSFKAVCKFRS